MPRLSLASWAESLNQRLCDVLVVGAGATGLGVAVQAALEGRSVVLIERNDVACGTSSRSTKLLHGGVRYLAQGHIALVHQALRERAQVLRLAPHVAQPLSFVVVSTGWVAWLVHAVGLLLYRTMAGRFSLGPTTLLGLAALRQRLPKLPGSAPGVRYWDGQFEDARLALTLARTAQAHGAQVRNHTQVVALQRHGAGWQVDLRDSLSGETATVQTRCVVNATGVWIDQLRGQAQAKSDLPPLVRPSQGVHLVVERSTLPLTEGVLVPKTSDGRVLFAIPWLGATLIGTTDTPRPDAPTEPQPLQAEIDFLFEQTRLSLGVTLEPQHVRSIWVGLRPLVNTQPQAGTADISREHLIVRDVPGCVSVTGGKWTTYRAMAHDVLATLTQAGDLPATPTPVDTTQQPLWGSEPSAHSPAQPLSAAPGLHLLGSHAAEVLQLPGHDRPLGLGLTEAMVRYSARNEWAITVEDMLARRWRTLFLDARLAQQIAPQVAAILQQETGINPQLDAFVKLCDQYILNTTGTTHHDHQP